MNTPLISVVIPVYEPTAFFSEALESLTIQTFKDFNVVVSDDTLTSDKAKKIITQFPALSITYVQNKTGKGIFNNLNNAIRHSKGNFVQIFCQDDVMLPLFLEKQIGLLQKYPEAGLAFSRYLDVDAQTRILPSHPYMEAAAATWQPLTSKEKAFNYLFAFGCFPGNLSPVMLNKKVVDELGYFDEAYTFGGDYEYWIRVAQKFGFAYNRDISLYVRTHNGRASKTLGVVKLVPDAAKLYRFMYNNSTVRASRFKKYLQVNSLVTGYFKEVTLHVLKGSLNYAKLYRHLHSYPFHIPVMIMIMLHRKMKGKFTWFVAEKDC